MDARVCAYDPVGMGQAKEVLGGIEFCDGPYACAEGADALVIVFAYHSVGRPDRPGE
jgi:UDPglucose 6-dehydrogenase